MTYFPYMMFFCFSLILGSLLSISSSSWVLIWAGLEINMLSFIPLMVISSTESHIESAMKYFLAQSLGSGFVLIGGLGMFFSSLSIMPMNMLQLFLLIGILIKLGVPPCHLWFPAIMSFISWPLAALLSTWQKIVPLFILFYTVDSGNTNLFMFIIILSSLISAMGGLTQTQLKPLLAYSSIGHMSWMLAGSLLSTSLSMTYFIIYALTSVPLMFIFYLNNFNSMKSMSSTVVLKYTITAMLLMLILSLGGVPPFLGFFPKWMVIQLTSSFSFMITIILIVGAMINLFYYLNIIFISTSSSSTPLINTPINVTSFSTIISISVPLMLLMGPLFMLF